MMPMSHSPCCDSPLKEVSMSSARRRSSSGVGPPTTRTLSTVLRLLAGAAILTIGLMAGCGSPSDVPPSSDGAQADSVGGDASVSTDPAAADSRGGGDTVDDTSVATGELAISPAGPGGGGAVLSSSRFAMAGRVFSMPYRGTSERFTMTGGM